MPVSIRMFRCVVQKWRWLSAWSWYRWFDCWHCIRFWSNAYISFSSSVITKFDYLCVSRLAINVYNDSLESPMWRFRPVDDQGRRERSSSILTIKRPNRWIETKKLSEGWIRRNMNMSWWSGKVWFTLRRIQCGGCVSVVHRPNCSIFRRSLRLC